MTASVVGLGKIGLPLAVQIASRGQRVIGADRAPEVVDLICAGRAPFPGEPGLEEGIRAALDAGLLEVTTDTVAAVSASEVVVVVVPLVVDAQASPDFTAIDSATAEIARGLQPGTLVAYETTLPVGTTRDRFAPALAAGSGLVLSETLFVCHSPERVSSGTVFQDLRRYPKLVGGIDSISSTRALAFYRSCLEFDERPDLAQPNGVWDLGSAEAAELAKLAETTYRDVNIAYANELATISERLGLDVGPIIAACNSQPYSHIHEPGVAVGGHCIPVYPHFLLAGAPEASLPRAARAVNAAMPAHAVDRLAAALGTLEGLTIVVLGLAYRAGVREDAFSGAWSLVRELEDRGAKALVHDPLYSREGLLDRGLTPYELGEPCDGVVLQTAHPEYSALTSADAPGARALIDGRRMIDPARWPDVQVIRLGG